MAEAPYPGLRSFERYEADIFFGRETHIDTMIDRLAEHRFLAVTGSSGSGKSSLVKAGLFQGLEMGLVAKAGPNWRIATMRPGEHPMQALGAALAEVLGTRKDEETSAALGPLSMLAELRERPLPGRVNLLILVDQFEELFRYRGSETREEAEAFVALLLGARRQPDSRIFVVLTMRSDFLGQCAQFEGLAEAVTDSLYLCPRLDRDQIAAAIERPAAVFGGRVEQALVERMTAEMGADPDQLPLMQHALLRLWDSARARDPTAPVLTLADYEAVDGLRGSLSRHADEILAAVTAGDPKREAVARRLFCLLVEGEGEAAVRRPSPAAEAVAVTGTALDEIADLTAPFRASGANFLSLGADQKLMPDTILDIGHESLIRQWRKLREWARDEAVSAEQYREFERRARRWDARLADLLAGTELDIALSWRKREHPAPAWAARYGGDFDLAMRFLDESLARRDTVARGRLQRRRLLVGGLALLALAFGLLAGFGLHQASEAKLQTANAQRNEGEAKQNLNKAELAQSQFLVIEAEDTIKTGDGELAGLTARAALPADLSNPDRPMWALAMSALVDARAADRNVATFVGHTGSVWSAAFSPDGTRIVTASDDHTARVWDAQMGAVLFTLAGHMDIVRSAVFSPDGTRIVTASDDNTARLWDARTGAVLAILTGHTARLVSAAFSPDGTRIVTASDDHTARLWDAKTGAALATLTGHTSAVLSAAFSPDGTRVVTASTDNTARLWDAQTGAALATLSGHVSPIASATFSPDGTRIVTASSDDTARLWDAQTGELIHTLSGHTAAVRSAAFSPDGTLVVTASYDGTARLWDAKTGALLAPLVGHKGYVASAAFSPDGRRIITASTDKTARVWDGRTGTPLATLTGPTGYVLSAAFSPDGTHIVAASTDHTARLWDVQTDAALAAFTGHSGYVLSAAFSPDGAGIFTVSSDNTTRVWDGRTEAAPVATLTSRSDYIRSAAFNLDGTRVITLYGDNTARLWDTKTGAAGATLAGHTNTILSAMFSPDSTRIVTASADQTARLWDAKTGAPLVTLSGHTGAVQSAAFSPDGTRIVTASADGTARVWDAQTGAPLVTLAGHKSYVLNATFSPDGTRIVTASDDKTARLWDAKTGAPLATLSGHTGAVQSAAFSPDGTRIVTASDDNTARLWDAEYGVALATLIGHTDTVLSASFSPDGSRIVTTSTDKTVRLWPVWPLLAGDTVAYADIAASRVLTATERETLLLADAPDGASAPVKPPDDVAPDKVCDRLTTNWFDPHRAAPGVPFDSINAGKAVPACQAAIAATPGEPRFSYELGRAMERAGQFDDATRAYRAAADKGYAAAAYGLASLYLNGKSVAKNPAEALRLYQQAAQGGHLPAYANVAQIYWDGVGVAANHTEALRWLERGAAAGDPFSHRRLGELYETGDGVPRDIAQALLHHAIEVRVFERFGAEDDAIVGRVRRGADARALPPEVAVKIAHEAAAWRPTPVQ